MNKIKITEVFYSLQGEGKFTGVPSVFFRTFGCNYTCSGFGMPRGEQSEERLKINPEDYTDLSRMPLVKTGCDSYASWDPRFRHLAEELTVDEAVQRVLELLPEGKFRNEHLVITGGEPLLQVWHPFWKEFLSRPEFDGVQITFETNGSQSLIYDFAQFLSKFKDRLTFSVSAKLPCSGEPWEKAIQPIRVCSYEKVGDVYLKFVVATEEDFEDAKRAVNEFLDEGFTGDIYLMPIGGVEDVYNLNKTAVAEKCMELGWRFSDRLQCSLWQNAWGT